MADVFSKRKRSEVMSRIRSRGNERTELRMIALFRAAKITGWRRHLPLPGRPDFAFRAEKVAVFVDGCFWHGCPRHYRAPCSAKAFWRNKVETNRARDRRVSRELRRAGWSVLRIWECALSRKRVAATLARIVRALECGRRSETPSQPRRGVRSPRDKHPGAGAESRRHSRGRRLRR